MHLSDAAATALEERWGADLTGRLPCPIPDHDGGARLMRDDGDELRLAPVAERIAILRAALDELEQELSAARRR